MKQCLGGLHAQDTFEWKLEVATPLVITERSLSTPTCVSFALTFDPWASQIHAELLDERDVLLAKSTGRNLLLLPSTGVLCLPEHTQMRLRVQTSQPPVAGVGKAAIGQ